MNGITQLLMNIFREGRPLALAIIGIIALVLVVFFFANSRGSVTKVVVVVACAGIASIVAWNLPDILALVVSESPSFTGINSRY